MALRTQVWQCRRIGVTMQEQGVSRIVAVDMEAAVSLAELT
jgi:chromosome segregation protein